MKQRRYHKHRASGFTLVEASISILLMALILATVMDFFIVMTRTTVAADSSMFASMDSNKAMSHIVELSREARWLALPDDVSTTFAPPGSNLITSYQTTFNSYNVDTGVEIMAPAGATNPTIALTSGNLTLPIYNRDSDGANLYIYRANSDGTPNASSGKCLWEYGTDSGVSVNKALITSISSVGNAVQFQRPTAGTTLGGYEMDVKIISSYYSPIYGNDTNESTNGTSATTLTGKCVLLRDCELSSNVHSGTSSTGPHWSAN